jgi:hypothetical protein
MMSKLTQNVATQRLSQSDHEKMLKIGIDFRKRSDDTKQVFLRDEALRCLSKVVRKMNLRAHQIGIHPGNRDTEKMTSRGVWLRGGKIIQSGFSFEAMGKLYAFEDHPTHRHIAKHTVDVTKSDEFGDYDEIEWMVGPGNWSHSNQFARQVGCRSKCSDPTIPTIDGRIDTDKILNDPMNIRLSEYLNDGVIWWVFPYWVEEVYEWMPELFQSASNQEQQVQEGSGFSDV